jgi:hypothetical protein
MVTVCSEPVVVTVCLTVLVTGQGRIVVVLVVG